MKGVRPKAGSILDFKKDVNTGIKTKRVRSGYSVIPSRRSVTSEPIPETHSEMVLIFVLDELARLRVVPEVVTALLAVVIKELHGKMQTSAAIRGATYVFVRKGRSRPLRLGWRNFRSALASSWRMRSRLTERFRPTSSSVYSLPS